MQPRIIDPRSAIQRMAQAIDGNDPNTRDECPNRMHTNEKSNAQSTDQLQARFQSNPYGTNTDTSGQTFEENTSRDDVDDENKELEVQFNR